MFFQIENLSVFYDKVHVLYDISINVVEGEIVTLVGSNGAGKSTLINTVTGILRAKSGNIIFDGRSIIKEPSNKIVEAGIVQVPEGRQVFPLLTLFENLEMGSYIPAARKRRPEMLKKVLNIFPELEKHKNQMAGTLSGGQQQMLAIARALMACPRLLILDEPSLGLAPLIVKDVFRTVKEINETTGTSVLLVEQNVRQSLGISDRAYVLENGYITLEGSGSELLNNESVKAAYLGI